MMTTKHLLCLLCLIGFSIAQSSAQESGTLTGDFQTQNNFFIRDSAIGAANTPQYDQQKFGGQTWMNLNYRNWGFDIGLRFDAFYNSNLNDPQDSYTALGIGRWHIRKEINNLDITAGYIYDQIGSGVLFRSYEVRPLAIDNALVGGRLIYNIDDNWRVKIMAGQQKKVEKQKNLFENYDPIITAAAIDGYIPVNHNLQLIVGAGAVNRTLDNTTMNQIVSDINTYDSTDAFIPKFNTTAFTVYNTLNYKDISWYVEGSYKTSEALNVNRPQLDNKNGYNLYTSLTYARKGLGITAQYKRTNHFILRLSPLQTLTKGQIAFLPPMARQNTYRLTARYNAATQEVGEQAAQLDVMYTVIPRKLTLALNLSNIMTLDNQTLYREAYFEATYKKKRKYKLITGFQFQQYNMTVYQGKGGMLYSYVPYAELAYKITRKKSLRVELQYMHNKKDYGSWVNALVEFNIAPHWSFAASNMINVVPLREGKKHDKIENFYSFLVSYTNKSNRFDLSYVRQVDGIVCTGGVCRYEPAFNGVRFEVNSRF